jgi:hypothetical protein
VFRILRILKGYKSADGSPGGDVERGVNRQIAFLAFFMVSVIFIGAGVVHSLELSRPHSFAWPAMQDNVECEISNLDSRPYYEWENACRLDFFQAVYFIIITVTTVGFGDMHPNDNLGRIVILGILVPMFVLVPQEISKLTDLMDKQSKYMDAYQSASGGHAVVCGDIQLSVARSFLLEFFHPDHGDQEMKLVFLAPHDPDPALESLITDQQYSDRVRYIRGSPLSTVDLNKAKLHDASAVFVLTSQFSQEVMTADATAVLMVKAIKSVCPWVVVYCQLISPQNTIHSWAQWDSMVCIEQLKMGLLAKSCLCPGFSTLIANLISSSSDYDLSSLPKRDRKWSREYMGGYGQEVYW